MVVIPFIARDQELIFASIVRSDLFPAVGHILEFGRILYVALHQAAGHADIIIQCGHRGQTDGDGIAAERAALQGNVGTGINFFGTATWTLTVFHLHVLLVKGKIDGFITSPIYVVVEFQNQINLSRLVP